MIPAQLPTVRAWEASGRSPGPTPTPCARPGRRGQRRRPALGRGPGPVPAAHPRQCRVFLDAARHAARPRHPAAARPHRRPGGCWSRWRAPSAAPLSVMRAMPATRTPYVLSRLLADATASPCARPARSGGLRSRPRPPIASTRPGQARPLPSRACSSVRSSTASSPACPRGQRAAGQRDRLARRGVQPRTGTCSTLPSAAPGYLPAVAGSPRFLDPGVVVRVDPGGRLEAVGFQPGRAPAGRPRGPTARCSGRTRLPARPQATPSATPGATALPQSGVQPRTARLLGGRGRRGDPAVGHGATGAPVGRALPAG